MKRITWIMASASALFLGLAGCQKDTPDTDVYAAVDNSIADGAFQDVETIVFQQAAVNGLGRLSNSDGQAKMEDCPTVTLSEPLGTYPNTMTIDFGTGCTGYFGVVRSGKLITTFTGPYSSAGTIITTTPDNYHINGYKVEGTKTVTNQGVNGSGNIWFTVEVSDGLITFDDGQTVTWNSSRSREWTQGSGTADISDDVYSISDGPGTGYAVTGVNRNGTPFTAHIAAPLIRAMDCRWLTAGVLEVTPDGLLTRSIDFGDGTCDNEALVSIGEYATSIILPL